MRCVSVAFGFAFVLLSGELRAQPTAAALDLDWQGPEGCDEGAAVRAKVLRLLGGSTRAALQETRVSVRVRRESGHFIAVLETTSANGGGKKRLEGESCEALALASAVVIALSIDPEASFAGEDAPSVPPAALPPAPVVARSKSRPSPAPPSPPRRAPRALWPYLQASVGVLFQLLDDPSGFTGAGAGLRYRRLSVELGGAVYRSQDVTRQDRPQVGAELGLMTAELLGCYALVPFRLGALEACPGVRLEYLSASAFGVSHPDDARVLIGSGLLAGRGRLRATPWLSAQLDLGLAVRPFQPRFVLLGLGEGS